MSDNTNTEVYNYGNSVTVQTVTGGSGSTSPQSQSPLVVPSYRVSTATNNTNNANTSSSNNNVNRNASFTSLSGSQRAPPERIPSRRHLTNSSFAGGAQTTAPAVPSSRPGTPRDLEPSRSFSRSADTNAVMPYASPSEGSVGPNTVARGGAPQPPSSKPQPLQVNAVQSTNTAATTGASSDLPPPIVSRNSSPTRVSAGPPAVRPGTALRSNTASPSGPNVSGSFVAAGIPSDTKTQNTAARPNENLPSRASPPSSRPPASAGSPKAASSPLNPAPSPPRGSAQLTGLVPPSRESVVLGVDEDGDEYASLKVVMQNKPLRSGYEEALALAALPRDPDEEAAERERIARREQKNKQKLSGGENGRPKLEIGLPSSVSESKPSSAHLTSPSRDQFGALNTIDRRHLHSAPKCEKLFQYEEPLEYGPTNREAMVWSPPPAVATTASDRHGGGIRRGGGGGDHHHQNFPPPVGLTLYEFRGGVSGAASLHGRKEDTEGEPYEGRNDLVRQLREYELRQSYQDDLKQHRSGSSRQPPYADERNGKRVSSLRSGPLASDDHDYYFTNGFGGGNSRADPQQQYDTTPGYFDLMYGGGVQAGARGGAYDDQAPHHYGGGAQHTTVRAPAGVGVTHPQRTNSPRPNHPARAGSRGPSQAQHHHHSAAPAPSYGSTYAEFARGGENKIVRSFPSEWRVGTNLHRNQLEDSSVAVPFPHPKQGGGGGGGYVSLNQSVASSRQQSIDRYGPRRQSVGGGGNGVIAGRTPYEN